MEKYVNPIKQKLYISQFVEVYFTNMLVLLSKYWWCDCFYR